MLGNLRDGDLALALEKQVVPISFDQGIDSKTDPKKPTAKLATLENASFQTAQEIRKRQGFAALSKSYQYNVNFSVTTSTLASGAALATLGDDLVTGDGSFLYSYSKGPDFWTRPGLFVPLKITPSAISVADNTSAPTQTYQDSAYDSGSGLSCFVWLIGTVGYYSIVERTTGNILVKARMINGSSGDVFNRVKVMAFQNNFVFFYVSGNALKIYRIPTSTPLADVTLVSLTITVANSRSFDVSSFNSRLYIAADRFSATGITLAYLDSSFTLSSLTNEGSHTAAGCLSLWGDDSNRVWVGYSDNTNVYYAVFDANIAAPVAGPATFQASANVNQITGISTSTSVSLILFCAYSNHSTVNKVVAGTITFSGTKTATTGAFSLSLASKLFTYGSNFYALALYGDVTTGQPTYFLYQFTPGAVGVVGKLAPSIAYDSTRTVLPEVVTISSGKFQVAYSQSAGSAEIAAFGSTWSALLDFTVTPSAAELSGTLHLTGGHLWMYDGINVCEHGFHLYPDSLSYVITATGTIVQGSYQYIAVFEWIDGQGQLHRSATSLPLAVPVLAGGASSIAVTVSTLRVTSKSSLSNQSNITNPVQVVLYRTAPNGSIFYYLGRANNSVGVDTVTITDSTVDVTANIQLYTTGGQVQNSSAPACSAVTVFKNRLIVVPSDNPYSWWYSQPAVSASGSTVATPVEFSQLFIQNMDQTGGPLTGAAVMDDKLIFMKGTVPYFVVGNGPALDGTGNDFSLPQLVTSPVGAVSQASMVMTPVGLMFQAANSAGIWLLDRSLQASYIGAEVETYNSQTVTSAVLCAAANQVRFTLSGGSCLVYDYLVKQWMVSLNIAAVQACLFQGKFTYVTSGGQVYQESASSFTDNGTFVGLRVVTSWIQVAGLQGFQRVYDVLILGDYESAHTLNAKVYYDFDDSTVAQTSTITAVTGAPYQWRLLLNRQKCEAIKIELYDTQNSPAEGLRLSAISLRVGVKGGLNRSPLTKTFQ